MLKIRASFFNTLICVGSWYMHSHTYTMLTIVKYFPDEPTILFLSYAATTNFAVTTHTSTVQATAPTFSEYWYQDNNGGWHINDENGNTITNAWLCDDAVVSNNKDHRLHSCILAYRSSPHDLFLMNRCFQFDLELNLLIPCCHWNLLNLLIIALWDTLYDTHLCIIK